MEVNIMIYNILKFIAFMICVVTTLTGLVMLLVQLSTMPFALI